MGTERLNRFLSSRGVGSRRSVDGLITAGRVLIDGVVAEVGAKVDPAVAVVTVDGKRVAAASSTHVTLLLNKPVGVVTSVRDPQHRPTVMQLVEQVPGLVPVGRLDMDSRGLLLLSNDGDLVHRLTHPRHGVIKRYRVRLTGDLGPHTRERLTTLVMLDGRPAKAFGVHPTAEADVFDIEMAEGRKREVRRICAAAGYEAVDLCRVGFGPIKLGLLPEGSWQPLSRTQVAALYACVGLPDPSGGRDQGEARQ